MNDEISEMVDGAQVDADRSRTAAKFNEELEATKRDLDEMHVKFVEEMLARKASEQDLQSMRAVYHERERKLLQLQMVNSEFRNGK